MHAKMQFSLKFKCQNVYPNWLLPPFLFCLRTQNFSVFPVLIWRFSDLSGLYFFSFKKQSFSFLMVSFGGYCWAAKLVSIALNGWLPAEEFFTFFNDYFSAGELFVWSWLLKSSLAIAAFFCYCYIFYNINNMLF